MKTGKRHAKWSFAVLLLILVLSMACSSFGDTIAPRPSPAKWRIVPVTLGPTSIQMAAITALDANDMPVQYLCESTSDGSASSAWQSDANYTATGLTPNTPYTFRLRTRDSASPTRALSNWSYSRTATTDPAYASGPTVLRLDLNNTADNNEPNTQVGFLPFIIEDSGSEVNGIVIDLGGTLNSARRDDPCGGWTRYGPPPYIPGDACYYNPRAGEAIYRDFIYGVQPSGVSITLWGLGANRDCNIMIWSWDSQSIGDANRVAKWYANGTYIFDANFMGGPDCLPQYDNQSPTSSNDFWKWAFKARATSDAVGRIVLTSTRGPYSPTAEPFAFVNALQVEPNANQSFAPPPYAHRPVPFDEAEDVPVKTYLKWRNGYGVVSHDLYLGTDYNDVNEADESSPLCIGLDLGAGASAGYDPYGAAGYLALGTTCYWRVDETTDTDTYKGEVWSFTTGSDSVVENFDFYADNTALRNTWQNSGTDAEVSVEAAISRNGNSMKYYYKNDLEPYYSEAIATIGTGNGELNIDPDWLGMGAKAMSLWFYGKPTNDANEKMYVKLTDGSANVAQVLYDGDMNDIRVGKWQEWNIALVEFIANNPSFDLSSVSKISIGFGDASTRGTGTVYFEDIRLYPVRCVLAKRSADFAKADYAPLDVNNHPGGDCKVDYQELEIMTEYWLDVWDPWWIPPSDYVAHWPMNEGTGNKIFTDPCNPLYTGTFSPTGVIWASPGRGGAHALYFDGNRGTRVSCGSPYIAIGPTPPDTNAMTLSVWVKWSGLRNDAYEQGLISKANGWAEPNMIFRFEVNYRSSFGLRHYITGGNDVPNLYAPAGILIPYIGQWIHLAATYPHPSGNPADANSYAKLYLNGVEVASGPWRFSHGDPHTTDLTIGNNWSEAVWPGSPESFYGYLDEPRIYKRALTASEIAYMAGREPPCNLYDEFWDFGYPKVINLKDYDVLTNHWLEEELWPR